jgi:acyl-CoA dehydrogenase
MRYRAAWLFEQGLPCGPDANVAKLLASEASWAGGQRLPRRPRWARVRGRVRRRAEKTRLYSVAPVSNNLVLAYLGQHVLGMPRSY